MQMLQDMLKCTVKYYSYLIVPLFLTYMQKDSEFGDQGLRLRRIQVGGILNVCGAVGE